MEGPRALKPAELPALMRLCNRVFRPDGGDMGREFAYYLNEAAAAAGRLRVFADGAEVVAHCGYRRYEALVFGARVSAGCIGAVACDPERRGQGLGTRLFLDSIAAMKAEGVDFAMISGGRGLYTRNGAVAAGRDRKFSFRAGGAAWKSDAAVSPAGPGDAPALAALYRAKPVRFLRPPSEWADIIAGRWCMNRPAKLFCVRRGGELVAYAAVRQPAFKDPPGTAMLLGEFAGCRRTLAEVLPGLAELGGCPAIEVQVAGWDAALAAELAARGLESAVVPAIGGTVKLVNLPQLLKRLGALLAERAGPRVEALAGQEAPGRAVLTLGAERLELSEEDACRVVFGTPDRAERSLLEGRGELGRLLGAALPVEIPWYGYNYV